MSGASASAGFRAVVRDSASHVPIAPHATRSLAGKPARHRARIVKVDADDAAAWTMPVPAFAGEQIWLVVQTHPNSPTPPSTCQNSPALGRRAHTDAPVTLDAVGTPRANGDHPCAWRRRRDGAHRRAVRRWVWKTLASGSCSVTPCRGGAFVCAAKHCTWTYKPTTTALFEIYLHATVASRAPAVRAG